MATARRLYLYVVSAASLGVWTVAAVLLLRLILNRAGVGSGLCPSCLAPVTDAPDRDALAFALAAGAVGLVLWLIHWGRLEWSVRAAEPSEEAVAERHSIIRSAYFLLVLAITLLTSVTLLVQLVSRAVPDMLNASGSSFLPLGDDWSIAIVVVLLGVWAYHAAGRARDVRQGPVIEGAAAWISRLYLYFAALEGVIGWVGGIGTLITVVAGQWAFPVSWFASTGTSAGPAWVRPVTAAVMAILVWLAVWLVHWLYADRLRSGHSAQSAAERASRVRLGYLGVVVLWAVLTVVTLAAQSLGQLLIWAFDLTPKYPGTVSYSFPAWYVILTPAVAALPVLAAWLWHRRLALAESAEGPAGVSARRVMGYLEAFLGMATLAVGMLVLLSTLFQEWFAGPATSDSLLAMPRTFQGLAAYHDQLFRSSLASALAVAVVGLAIWLWPWISATRRRAAGAADRVAELTSSARAYYLYVLMTSALLVGAAALGVILYRYLRVGLGLDEHALASDVSGPFAWLLVAAAVYLDHAWVQWRDRATPRGSGTGREPQEPQPPQAQDPREAAPTEP